MRIKKLQVSNLFGEYNYNIDIKYNKRITILHGPNGSGKTSILKFLDGFFNLKLFEIIGIPFDDFTIYFDNGSILKIIRNENPELFQLSDSEQKLDALKIIYNKNSTKLEYKIKYKMKVWLISDQTLLLELPQCALPTSLIVSPDGTRLYARDMYGVISVWGHNPE